MISFGTCSWKYPSWEGLVYPSKKPGNYLLEYAKKYSTVEIDQWFWSLFPGHKPALPEPGTVSEYLQSVSDTFSFTVKAPNAFTRPFFYKGGRNPYFLSSRLLHDFWSSLEAMQRQITAVIFQFEQFNDKTMLSTAENLLLELRERIPRNIPAALEFRNNEFFTEDFMHNLVSAGFIPVLMQGYGMRPVWKLYDQYSQHFSDSAIVRLHGHNRKGIEKKTGEKWNSIVQDESHALEQVAQMLQRMQNNKMKVVVNINNHFEGSAPLTIARLEKILAFLA
jgi:uncharacterized protein YecE (DUF72 family)